MTEPSPCPHPTHHYVTHLDRGRLDLDGLQKKANEMYGRGYRLDKIFEQSGNTVMVFEHYQH